MFIAIEGPDGCGKSSHAARLKDRLKAKFFKFPNKDTPSGRLIYENLGGGWYTSSTMKTDGVDENPAYNWPDTPGNVREALVFQSLQLLNRMELAEEIIRAEMAGDLVLDRYWPSGYAYGKADGLDGEYLINIHKQLPQPDLFILLDIDIQDSVSRRPERRDRYEANLAFMEKVMRNYRELWARSLFPGEWAVVDARGTPEQTASRIDEAIVRFKEKTS